ncbi:MAG: ComEA family DNA-binding protein [Deltaproteobacteria bacterium]|nr:ComEA family DNA-binding protein [Deltaproteobacteria bacterium]
MRLYTVAGLLIAAIVLAVSTSATSAENKLVNINTASATELAGVKGIGDAKAKAIVEYREKNGPFKSVDDLGSVKGIGDKLLAKLRPQVTVGETAAAQAAAPAGAAAPAPAKH